MNSHVITRRLERVERAAERLPTPGRKTPTDGFLLVLPRAGETAAECLERNGLTDDDVKDCAMMVFGSTGDDDTPPNMREVLGSRPREGIVS